MYLRETGKGPIKTGWAETDKGQPGKPNERARWVAKEYRTHARAELYASTPPLEALKVVLSEIATGERKGKVVARVDVRRADFYFNREGEYSLNCRPRIYQAGDEPMGGLLRCRLHGTRDATQNWEEMLASTLSNLKLTRGNCVPIRVARSYQERTCGGNRARGRHHTLCKTASRGTLHRGDIDPVRDQESAMLPTCKCS